MHVHKMNSFSSSISEVKASGKNTVIQLYPMFLSAYFGYVSEPTAIIQKKLQLGVAQSRIYRSILRQFLAVNSSSAKMVVLKIAL